MNLAEESPNSEEEEEQPRRRRRKDKRKGRRRRRRRGGRARLSVTMEMLQNVALVLPVSLLIRMKQGQRNKTSSN